MPIAADILNALYDGMPDLRCRVRVGRRTVITRCVSSGISRSREDRDEGQADTPRGNVRFAASDEPTPKVGVGDVIEIMLSGNGEVKYTEYRVANRLSLAGGVRLEIEGANQ